MRLCFRDKDNKEWFYKKVKDEQEAVHEIKMYCQFKNISVFYIRKYSKQNGIVTYDFGKHDEFFKLYTKDGEMNGKID